MALRFSHFNKTTDSRQVLLAALPRLISEVPYYREHRAAYANADDLPVITRADLSSIAFQRLVPDSVDAAAELTGGSARIMSTSGSTSEPVRTLSDLQTELPTEYWAMWGLTRVPRFACLTSPACMGEACARSNADRATRQTHPNFLFFPSTRNIFAESDDFIRALAAEWADFRPDVLSVNPVYFHWVLRRCAQLELSWPTPKLILCGYQYLSHAQRRAFAGIAPLTSDYGATELAGTSVAMGCPAGHLHVLSRDVHLELQPWRRRADLGELIISTPLSRTSPMIRYSPGDLGRLSPPSETGCPLDALPLLELWGRSADCLESPHRTWATREIDDLLEPAHWLDFYTVRQAASGALRLQLVANDPPAGGARAIGALFEGLGFTIAEVRLVEQLTLASSLKLQVTGPEDADA